jgi:universal stress protein family protein
MSDPSSLIADDGSLDAKAAITTVGELLTPGPALVVTVWHPAELSVSTSAGAATYAPIVVGAHGQGRLTDLLLGSVPGRVIHHTDRPVVVVRTKRSPWAAALAALVSAPGEDRPRVPTGGASSVA